MKWQTKSNQFSYSYSEFYKVKIVDAIKIDSKSKSIFYIKIENCIEYILKNLYFFDYKEILLSDELDILIIGIDEDLKKKNSFLLTKNNTKYYGDAIVIRAPKSGNLQKLKSTKYPLEKITSIIEFN